MVFFIAANFIKYHFKKHQKLHIAMKKFILKSCKNSRRKLQKTLHVF